MLLKRTEEQSFWYDKFKFIHKFVSLMDLIKQHYCEISWRVEKINILIKEPMYCKLFL